MLSEQIYHLKVHLSIHSTAPHSMPKACSFIPNDLINPAYSHLLSFSFIFEPLRNFQLKVKNGS